VDAFGCSDPHSKWRQQWRVNWARHVFQCNSARPRAMKLPWMDRRMTANCFHPGLVATGFNRNNGLLMNLGMTIPRPQHGCRARSILRGRANVRRTAVLFHYGFTTAFRRIRATVL
jgi:hypothetical protein